MPRIYTTPMSTTGYARWGMTLAAVCLSGAGAATLFAPAELLSAAGSDPRLSPFVQLLGALYLGFGMADWTAKDSVIGGIYGRALALGNLVHFAVGAMSLARGPRLDGAVFMLVLAVYLG